MAQLGPWACQPTLLMTGQCAQLRSEAPGHWEEVTSLRQGAERTWDEVVALRPPGPSPAVGVVGLEPQGENQGPSSRPLMVKASVVAATLRMLGTHSHQHVAQGWTLDTLGCLGPGG